MTKLNAFILAAGYGERLKPITDHIPKPLLPICGKPIIETVLDRISCLSPDIIAINTYHKSEQFENWRSNHSTYCNIIIFRETSLLGTGGALKNAESIVKNSVFIAHNADILTDIDLETLVRRHLDSKNIATLAVHNHDKFNNVWIDHRGFLGSVGRVTKEQNSGLCKIAFMGIAVYAPEFLDHLPKGNSSVVDAWLRSVAAGHSIGTVDFSGAAWTDIGTPDAYAAAVFDALKKDGETIYLHGSFDCSKTEFCGIVAIEEDVIIQAPSCISNCILLPGAKIATDTSIENVIIGPGFSIAVSSKQSRETIPLTRSVKDWFGHSEDSASVVSTGSGGSDRTYHRISHNNRTAILMNCRENDPDYIRHITYTQFFRTCSLPVPDMFAADEDHKQALFEDLGDLSLYSWLKCRRSPDEIETMYKKVLDIIVQLQTVAAERIDECPMLKERIFDYEHLRWETGYFMERFINGIRKINKKDPDLIAEFDRLAREVDAFPKTVLHRDFQSQNIMVTKGGIPRLIDYQGARLGPAAYDIASMLWDPYYRLEDRLRDRLIEYYIARMEQAQTSFREHDFNRSLLFCRLQRHMQALGAYGFLSTEKNKLYFLKYIPQTVDYLQQETALAKDIFPALHALAVSLS
ncbi:MAG: phosphotransferase [Nitrospirae bacterium]|nr:phosphotransferase [Nitrospirota bacterium]